MRRPYGQTGPYQLFKLDKNEEGISRAGGNGNTPVGIELVEAVMPAVTKRRSLANLNMDRTVKERKEEGEQGHRKNDYYVRRSRMPNALRWRWRSGQHADVSTRTRKPCRSLGLIQRPTTNALGDDRQSEH